MRRFSRCLIATIACLLSAAAAADAKRPSPSPAYTLVSNAPGSATLVNPGYNSPTAVELTSSGASGWGAIGFAVPSGLRLRGVTELSTEFALLQGGCIGGSPRFTIGVSAGAAVKEIYFYMAQPPSYDTCPAPLGVWSNTGNLATPTSLVDASSLTGSSQPQTFATVVAKYGGDKVAYFAIDFDSGWEGSTQVAEFDDTMIDGTQYTYEP